MLSSKDERSPVMRAPLRIEESTGVFYNRKNLPDSDHEGWERRMVYRVFLRSPYPPAVWVLNTWHTLKLGFINEMSLFPRGALDTGQEFKCYVSVLSATCPFAVYETLTIEMRRLCDAELAWLDLTELRWAGYNGGKGGCAVRTTTKAGTSDHVREHGHGNFLLKIGIPGGVVEDKLHVLPLIIGPFKYVARAEDVALSGEELLLFYRPLTLPQSIQDASDTLSTSSLINTTTSASSSLSLAPAAILIKESPELAIPGKIWDSALFCGPMALRLLTAAITADAIERQRTNSASVPESIHILDLSTGTGVCGLWLAAALSRSQDAVLSVRPSVTITFTDLEEAIETIRDNVALNESIIDSRITLAVRALPWGTATTTITGSATPADLTDPIDLIIACDVIYEAHLLPALVDTLNALSTPGKTRVLVGYKQRGLSRAEKERVWSLFSETFLVERLGDGVLDDGDAGVGHENEVDLVQGTLEKPVSAKYVGVELWLLTSL